MDDATLRQMRADLADKLQLISELQDEAAELAKAINDEEAARLDHPGADVREFRPRGWDGPTDQGSC